MNSRERAEEIADAQLWNWDPDVEPIIRRAFRDNMLVPAIQRAIVNESAARELAEAKLAEVSAAWGKAVTRAENAEARINGYGEAYEKAAKDLQAAALRLEGQSERNEAIDAATNEALETAVDEWRRRAMEAENKLDAAIAEIDYFRERMEVYGEALKQAKDEVANAVAAREQAIIANIKNSEKMSRLQKESDGWRLQLSDALARAGEARKERDDLAEAFKRWAPAWLLGGHMSNEHTHHGRGTPESGPEDPDCPCRSTILQVECAKTGCGFCVGRHAIDQGGVQMKRDEKPKAMTFFDDGAIEVELLGAPTSTGLVRCQWGDKIIVRNKVQLNPINEAAKELLK